MQGLRVLNMTTFFNREMLLYALGDIKFKKPVSLKTAFYILLLGLMWTLPLVLIFGLQTNVYFLALILVPPVVIGVYATRPIFTEKTLDDFIVTLVKFLAEPKGWTDLYDNNEVGATEYKLAQEIWISRREELDYLAALKERRLQAQATKSAQVTKEAA